MFSEKDIVDFQDLYLEHFGSPISVSEATELAAKFTWLMDLVYGDKIDQALIYFKNKSYG
jgi:hypothetical protein